MLYPFAIFRYLAIVLRWWQKRVGRWGVVAMLIAGTVLAVILNYTV